MTYQEYTTITSPFDILVCASVDIPSAASKILSLRKSSIALCSCCLACLETFAVVFFSWVLPFQQYLRYINVLEITLCLTMIYQLCLNNYAFTLSLCFLFQSKCYSMVPLLLKQNPANIDMFINWSQAETENQILR